MTLRANRHTHIHTIAHKYILRRNMVWLGQQLTATHTHTYTYKSQSQQHNLWVVNKTRDHKGGKESIQKEWDSARVDSAEPTRGPPRTTGWGGRDPKANKLVCKSGSRLGHQSFRDINGQQSLDSSNNGIWLMYENVLTHTSEPIY